MNTFRPFEMERWQSLHENRVAYNLSESGVHPLTLRELLALAGDDDVLDTPVGYGQSNGSDELRALVAALYGGAADPRRVVVCNGSAEANFLVAWELVRPGDEVAIIVPTYMQVHGLAAGAGAQVVEVPARERAGWQPDPDEIRRVVTDRTRLLVVTNPGNPTGAVIHDEVRAAIVEATARTGTWVLSDEVYAGAEVAAREVTRSAGGELAAPVAASSAGDELAAPVAAPSAGGAGATSSSPSKIVPETPSLLGAHERVVVTGSLSKAYGLAGLRIGWAAAADPHLAAQVWARSDYTTISTGELTDRLARVALDPAVRPRLLERTRGIIRGGSAVVEEWLAANDAWHWHPPDAGAIALLRYDGGPGSGELAERLLAEEDVLVVPGTNFGLGRYIRVGIGIRPEALRGGLARTAAAHRRLQPQIRT